MNSTAPHVRAAPPPEREVSKQGAVLPSARRVWRQNSNASEVGEMRHQLDPQAEAFLALLREVEASDAEGRGSFSLKRHREKIDGMASLGPPSEPVETIDDLSIPTAAGAVPARLYRPHVIAGLPKAEPVLIYYHGGGFIAGDLDSYDGLMRVLANRSGCAVLSVGYRLAPEHPYPAANEDAWAAVRWVSDRGAGRKLDRERIAVAGDSAGGLLAAWVAQRARDEGIALRLQLLLYPNLDATLSSQSWIDLGAGDYLVERSRMRSLFEMYLGSSVEWSDPKVSPAFAADLGGLAPAFVATADHDPLRDEGDDYASRLRSAGVAVEHRSWPGMIHGFASLAGVIDAGQRLIDEAAAAVRAALLPDRDEDLGARARLGTAPGGQGRA